uniref:Uncharacterized protein n=1 Tax=Lactuca sativa TaxID=4236 RepID=A0A9R1UHX9_LACSA|nr:hypothetical protein LSAT_V11C900506510 [Lactuca sativa]
MVLNLLPELGAAYHLTFPVSFTLDWGNMNWVQRKIYLYNVTFGLYMLDWWERYLFKPGMETQPLGEDSLVVVLMWFIFYNGYRIYGEFKHSFNFKMKHGEVTKLGKNPLLWIEYAKEMDRMERFYRVPGFDIYTFSGRDKA